MYGRRDGRLWWRSSRHDALRSADRSPLDQLGLIVGPLRSLQPATEAIGGREFARGRSARSGGRAARLVRRPWPFGMTTGPRRVAETRLSVEPPLQPRRAGLAIRLTGGSSFSPIVEAEQTWLTCYRMPRGLITTNQRFCARFVQPHCPLAACPDVLSSCSISRPDCDAYRYRGANRRDSQPATVLTPDEDRLGTGEAGIGQLHCIPPAAHGGMKAVVSPEEYQVSCCHTMCYGSY